MATFDTLIEGAKKQRQQAMLEIYNLCCEPVFNACLRIVPNEMDAEEIVQDAFLKAFDNVKNFSGTQKSFIAFVKTIAINRSIDLYRKHRNDPFFTDVENEADVIPEEKDEETYSFETIQKKINELPDGYRMVLCLHLLDEMDFDDIAKTMKVRPSTVRSQYVRAKEKLRQMVV